MNELMIQSGVTDLLPQVKIFYIQIVNIKELRKVNMDNKLQCAECEYNFSFKGALFTHQQSSPLIDHQISVYMGKKLQ